MKFYYFFLNPNSPFYLILLLPYFGPLVLGNFLIKFLFCIYFVEIYIFSSLSLHIFCSTWSVLYFLKEKFLNF